MFRAAKPLSLNRYEEGSTTIPNGSRLQANGSRSGLPLTRYGEGEDIVFARLEREWLLG